MRATARRSVGFAATATKRTPPDGLERAVAAGDDERGAALHRLAAHGGAQRDLIHIDQVLPQRLDVHLAPVGAWVCIEQLHDLGDRGEGCLTALLCRARGCRMLHSRRVLVILGTDWRGEEQ